MKKCGRVIIKYGLPAFCVLVICCMVFAINGIWPFGSESVDYYDMAQQLAAEYIQVYDEMHFDKSFIFDWYLNLGRGIPGTTYLAFSNLLLYLFPRDMLLFAFSVLLIVKLMAMAVTMRVLIDREAPKCPEFFAVILAAGYGLCGFVLMQYTIIAWLDVALLVPLIIMYTKRAVREGKIMGLGICIALMLHVSFMIPAMVIIFVFLLCGLYLLTVFVFERKKLKANSSDNLLGDTPHVLRLGIAVGLGLLISAWSWVPKVFMSAGGFRYELEASETIFDKYVKILLHVVPDYATGKWALLGISFAGAVCAAGVIKDIKSKNSRRLFFVIGTFIITFVQLLFENVQLFWHLGSYVNYPVRNGFLMYIVPALLAATYLGEFDMPGTVGDKVTASRFLVPASAMAAILLAAMGIYWYKSNPGMSVYTVFKVTMLCVAGCFLVYMALLFIRGAKYVRFSAFLIAAELTFYGVVMIGKPTYVTGYAEEVEQEGDYIRIAQQLKGSLGIKESALDRIKNPDETLNTNYGLFLKRATLSGWTTAAPAEAISSNLSKGYSVQYTRILDAGGDAFTDAIYHETQVVSCIEQDERLYGKVADAMAITDHRTGESREYSLYDCRYVLPFGNVISGRDNLEKVINGGGNYDNALLQAIGAQDEYLSDTIIKEILYEGPVKDELTFAIPGNKALYLVGRCADSDAKDLRIKINGKTVPVPSLKEPDNDLYPAHFNNGNLLLGCFEDRDVKLQLEKLDKEGGFDYDISIFTVDLDVLDRLCRYAEQRKGTFDAGKSDLTATVTGGEDSYLLLPIAYDKGFRATVNGNKAEIVKVDPFLMAVPLDEGDNEVHMTFFPEKMRLWVPVSVFAIFAIAVFHFAYVIRRRKDEKILTNKCIGEKEYGESRRGLTVSEAESVADRILAKAYIAGWTGVIILCMIIPVLYGALYYIKMIIDKF